MPFVKAVTLAPTWSLAVEPTSELVLLMMPDTPAVALPQVTAPRLPFHLVLTIIKLPLVGSTIMPSKPTWSLAVEPVRVLMRALVLPL